MTYMQCILCGALGGACPTIAKLASYYSTQPTAPIPELGALIGLGLFAVLGGIIATAFGSKDVKAAIVAGIAAPGIVTNVVAGQQQTQFASVAEAPKITTAGLGIEGLLGISAAYAQTDPDTMRGGGMTLTVQPVISGGKFAGRLEVFAGTGDGPVDLPVGVLAPGGAAQQIVVPVGTTRLRVGDVEIPVNGTRDVTVTITTEPSFGRDLLWALGGQRKYDVKDVEITPGISGQ